MKKLFLVFGILVASLSGVFFACSENESKCETCETSYKLTPIKFYGNEFDAKKYDDDSGNNSYYHVNLDNISELKNFFDLGLINVNLQKIKSLVVVNKLEKGNSNENIQLNNESLIFVYEEYATYYNVKIYNFANKKIQENTKFSNLKSTSLITNDIHNLANLYFKSTKYNVYAFIDKSLISFNDGEDELNSKISSEFSAMRMPSPDQEKCASPCPKLIGDICKNGGGFYICGTKTNGGGGNCGKNVLQDYLERNSSASYDYISIDEDLHYFKDVYLSTNGGNRIIDDYYILSDKLPLSNINLSHSIETFDLITEVLPLINNLIDNPNSSTILIDNVTKTKIIDYLYQTKDLYPDSYSKDKIQYIINQVNYFSNKSNNFITTNLSNY